MRETIRTWLYRHLGSHITIKVASREITVYGFNAMHVAFETRTMRWGWLCFHPPVHFLGWNWPWYFYASPNGTPCVSTIAIGPGLDRFTKRMAKERREMFGHNFDDDQIYNGLHREMLG